MSFIRNVLAGYGTPEISAFSAVNAGGRATSVVPTAGGIQMSMSNGVTADDFRILKKAAPTAPYTLTVHMFPTLWNVNYSGAGLVWRASASGNLQVFSIHSYQTSMNILIRNETANNNGASPTYSAGTDLVTVSTDAVVCMGPGIWLQMHDDGTTNRAFRYSLDGQSFQTVVTVGRTNFITPDEIGLHIGNINSGGSAPNALALFDSWSIT